MLGWSKILKELRSFIDQAETMPVLHHLSVKGRWPYYVCQYIKTRGPLSIADGRVGEQHKCTAFTSLGTNSYQTFGCTLSSQTGLVGTFVWTLMFYFLFLGIPIGARWQISINRPIENQFLVYNSSIDGSSLITHEKIMIIIS